MINLGPTLEIALRDLLQEGYNKEFGEGSDKIPNIKNLVQEWWIRLGTNKQDDLKNTFSKMENFAQYVKQKKKDLIFNEFKKFNAEYSGTDINDENFNYSGGIKEYIFKDLIPERQPSGIAQQNRVSPSRRYEKEYKKGDPSKIFYSHNLKATHSLENENIKAKQKPKANNATKVQDRHKNIVDRTTKPKDYPEVHPYHLKNGAVGKEYHETIDLKKIYPDGEIDDYSVGGLEEIGLGFNKKNNLIHGIPKKAGNSSENYEFEITVRFETNQKVKESKKVFIKILPDPKSLFKVLEPSEDLGDPKKHEYSKLITLDNYNKERNLFVASKRGRSHAHKATYRDDHAKIDYLKELGWSIIAVADGAGSARFSRVGSKIACEESVKYISSQLRKKCDELDQQIKALHDDEKGSNDIGLQSNLFEIIAHAVYTSAKAIQKEAVERKLITDDFHSTILLAIHKRYEFGDFIAGFWIGDGALAIYNEKKEVKLLGKPDSGEYSGQTVFITMNKYMETEELAKRIHYHLVQDFTALMAMSDGVSDPAFGTDNNLADKNYWDNLWQKLQKEFSDPNDSLDKKLLNWLDFWAEGEHDDRTIAILS